MDTQAGRTILNAILFVITKLAATGQCSEIQMKLEDETISKGVGKFGNCTVCSADLPQRTCIR